MAQKPPLGARGGADVYDSKVVGVSAKDDSCMVELSTHTGRRIEVRFSGVSRVMAASPKGMTVRALTEVAKSRETRVFVFANMDPSDPRSLKVAADRAEWRRDDGPWREC